MIIVLDNRDSFVENLARYIRLAGCETKVIRSTSILAKEVLALNPSGIVLSPGPGVPKDAGCCIELIQIASSIPILGVCLGHQCLADSYGGQTIRSNDPTHGRTSIVNHVGDEMFNQIPQQFSVGRYHSLQVRIDNTALMPTAWTQKEEIMALRHVKYPHFGLQFHPESILTTNGLQMIKNFTSLCR